jgi:mono/diheme cytochrome c family protein
MRNYLFLGTLLLAASVPPGNAALAKRDAVTAFKATVDGYCVTCHNDALLTAGLSLQHARLDDVGASADVWEKVLRKLRVQSMPPSGVPRPPAEAYAGFAAYLESELDRHARSAPDPGRPAMRRLNRSEYLNAVRDLLAVEITDETILPEDDTMFGFDNVGDVLTLSPLLAERYIAAARKVRRQALGEPDTQPVFDIYTVSGALLQDDRMGEDMPFGSRGGVSLRHHFPADGDYVLKIRLQRNSREYIRGMLEPHEFDVRLDGESVERRTLGGRKLGRSGPIFSSASTGDPEQERYERYADEDLEIRFFASAGTRTLTVTFLDDNTVPAEPSYPRHTLYDYAQYKGGVPGVHTVAIGGPYDPRGSSETASRRRILTCSPAPGDAEACAGEILASLAERAYRRRPSELEFEELLGFYREGAADGFEAGIGLALERILAGPEFLFLVVE